VVSSGMPNHLFSVILSTSLSLLRFWNILFFVKGNLSLVRHSPSKHNAPNLEYSDAKLEGRKAR